MQIHHSLKILDLNNTSTNILHRYVFVSINYFVFQIRSNIGNLCVDTQYKGQNEKFGLEVCIRDDPKLQGEQVNMFPDLSIKFQ